METGSGALRLDGARARVLIARGEKALRVVRERIYRSEVFIILGPVSKAFLLYEDMLREIYDRYGYSIVVPSSYDDVAVYVNMRKLGFRICRGSGHHSDIEIHCLERGEKPWPKILLRSGGALSLIFSEDLDPVDLGAGNPQTLGLAEKNIIYISHGVLQPSGIIIDRWVSLRIDPFEDLLALIDEDDRSLVVDFAAHGRKIAIRLRFG